MRRRRAEGTAWDDPVKNAERKARWYAEQGGKEKIVEATRRRREGAKEQGLKDFIKKLK